MSYWIKGIVLILVLELFIPSTKFKISGYFKEFICMKNTGESHSIYKKENKGLVVKIFTEKNIVRRVFKIVEILLLHKVTFNKYI